jgi:transcriptional regulator with XRE-family HTH domain
MSAADFRAELRELGLLQKDIARLLGVKPPQVNRWATGRAAVPRYAVLVLLLMRQAGRRGTARAALLLDGAQ